MDSDVGAKATVFIASELDLRMLAAELASGVLYEVAFRFDTDMFPPHEEFALCEALGFEVQLQRSSERAGYNFELTMATTYSNEAIMRGSMFDLSPWLEAYVGRFLDAATAVSA